MTKYANERLINAVNKGITTIGCYIHEFTPEQLKLLRHIHTRLGLFLDDQKQTDQDPQQKALSRFLGKLPLLDAKAALFEDVDLPQPTFWFGDTVQVIEKDGNWAIKGLSWDHFSQKWHYTVFQSQDSQHRLLQIVESEVSKVDAKTL